MRPTKPIIIDWQKATRRANQHSRPTTCQPARSLEGPIILRCGLPVVKPIMEDDLPPRRAPYDPDKPVFSRYIGACLSVFGAGMGGSAAVALMLPQVAIPAGCVFVLCAGFAMQAFAAHRQ